MHGKGTFRYATGAVYEASEPAVVGLQACIECSRQYDMLRSL